ncbi:MAG: hypothetical protein IH870_07340 [Chloroflexi bacterium]|nr:hypothetical protein [Chloroflexota bacterium]
MKKHRYFMPLAVGVLTVAVTGGVIFAQNSNSQESINSQIGTSPEGLTRQISPFNQGESGRIDLSHGDAPKQSIASRVAEILNLVEGDVQDAFDQAITEKQDDSLAYRLEHMVENEKLTEAEADEILNWFLGRPDAAAKLHRVLLRGSEAVEYRLNKMVERGVISQEEADAVLIWHGEMPQALKDLLAQRTHRSPDSKSQGQFRPSERFQGRDMDRTSFEGQRFDREGFAGRNFRRGGRRDFVPEVAGGLDQALLQ